MNSYELSRAWFEFCFNNPEKIKPGHSAVYFFAIEHCNRLGWKDKFGFPSQMVMEAVGIKNWRTYSAILKELVEFGFIEMVEISKNQYSSNIIAIVKNTKATTKALDKALQKHSTKQRQSTVSIDIQETKNKEQETRLPSVLNFDEFWNLYDKKVEMSICKKKYEKLSEEIRAKIKEHLPKYKEAQPDKQYRKNPATYLNKQSWDDELIQGDNKDQHQPEEMQIYPI